MCRARGSGEGSARTARSEPGGGPLRVTERRGLPPPGGQRLTRGAFGGLCLAERDKERKAVQPRPVQGTERCLQLGVFNLCRHSTRVRRYVTPGTTDTDDREGIV